MNALWRKIHGKFARPPRELAMFFVTSVGGRGVGIVCQLLQVPLVVKALGAEAFGLWMAMTSVANVVAFADLGMGIGVQNRLAELFAHRRHDEARRVFGSAFLFLAGIAAVLAGIFALAVSYLDFSAAFNLHDPETIKAAPQAALVVGLAFCAGFPAGLAQRLAFARQEGWMFNLSQALGNMLALALVAVVANKGWGLAAMAGAAQAALLAGNSALLAVQLKQLRWFSWRVPFEWAAVRGLLQVGAYFSVQQILNTVLFSLPQIVISTCLGAAAVAPYNILQRIFNLFAVVQNAFMLPLWPAYSQARVRGEFVWMKKTLRRSFQATVLFSVAPMIAGACFAPRIVGLWVGREVAGVTPLLTGLLCLWNAAVFLQQPFSFLLAGVSEIRRTTYYSTVSAVLSAALMFLLARPLGAPGVIAGLLLGYLPFNFLGSLLETRRYLRTAGFEYPQPATVATA